MKKKKIYIERNFQNHRKLNDFFLLWVIVKSISKTILFVVIVIVNSIYPKDSRRKTKFWKKFIK